MVKFQSSHLQVVNQKIPLLQKKITRSYLLRLNFMKIIVGEGANGTRFERNDGYLTNSE